MNLFRILICLLTQLKQSIDGTVKMTDQVERFRQEKKEVQKGLSKAEARIRKLEKPQSKKASSVTHETMSETLYEQERDRNQVLCNTGCIMTLYNN